jgi:hypothetical protein
MFPNRRPPRGMTTKQGARKFDLLEWMERIKRHFRGPPAANPKLVNYLAAGNIQGLRPLRYEKRVARNRFVALTMVLVIVLFGLFCFLARRISFFLIVIVIPIAFSIFSIAFSTFVMSILGSDKDRDCQAILVSKVLLREGRAPRVPNLRASRGQNKL